MKTIENRFLKFCFREKISQQKIGFSHDDEATTTDAPPPAAADADDASKGPKYDEATQALVDAANAARSEFDAADRVFRDLEREVQDLEKKLETDFGPGEFIL